MSGVTRLTRRRFLSRSAAAAALAGLAPAAPALGLPAAAPFDAIVIAAAGLDVPQALLEQLAIGGRLVAPVAEQGAAGAVGSQGESAQVLTLVERTGPAQWREVRLDRVFFVPLKSGVI